MLDPGALLTRDLPVIEHTYSSNGCILFAFCLGPGAAVFLCDQTLAHAW
jgi:hypothetical protein